MAGDLWRLGALELGASIARREVSAREVLEQHVARIAAVNPRVNAVTQVLAESARAAADAADREIAQGHVRGPLHGVPFSVKENLDVAGLPTTQGVPALAASIATEDAPVVARLRRAGAIPLARTNLPDFALRVHTDSGLYGATLNPFDPRVTPGGSSGGDAAALATGMVPLGLGNDIGGSLRNPAFCCGVASLKPSSHRIPHASTTEPQEPFLAAQLMSVDGPMARRVADVRAAFELLAGADPRSPFTIEAPFHGLPVPRPLRVALVPEPPGGPTHPAIAAAVRQAGRALADAGYAVEERTPPRYEDAFRVWARWLVAEIGLNLPLLKLVMTPSAFLFLEANHAASEPLDHAGSVQLLGERLAIARAWAQFQADWPLLVTPVWPQPPFAVGADVRAPAAAVETLGSLRCVAPANLLGLPAAAVPTGMAEGLPMGVQIHGPRFREDLALAAAECVERACGTLTPIDPRDGGA